MARSISWRKLRWAIDDSVLGSWINATNGLAQMVFRTLFGRLDTWVLPAVSSRRLGSGRGPRNGGVGKESGAGGHVWRFLPVHENRAHCHESAAVSAASCVVLPIVA